MLLFPVCIVQISQFVCYLYYVGDCRASETTDEHSFQKRSINLQSINFQLLCVCECVCHQLRTFDIENWMNGARVCNAWNPFLTTRTTATFVRLNSNGSATNGCSCCFQFDFNSEWNQDHSQAPQFTAAIFLCLRLSCFYIEHYFGHCNIWPSAQKIYINWFVCLLLFLFYFPWNFIMRSSNDFPFWLFSPRCSSRSNVWFIFKLIFVANFVQDTTCFV